MYSGISIKFCFIICRFLNGNSGKINFPRFATFPGRAGEYLGNIFCEKIIVPGKNNFRQILEPDLVPRRNSFGGRRQIFSGTSAKPMIANGSLQRGRAHRKKNSVWGKFCTAPSSAGVVGRRGVVFLHFANFQ